ncbi:LysR family transcriptional regulator [Mycobacterium sp. OAE908]|uniref:LysR family transcriptional regulator n=1 Tax=Mycobacterium sp. OAE908 TaxID=2817899 RepID=UPI001AE2DB5F
MMGRNLQNIDLNLLPALDALLRERNVTRAAERLCVSQPAMSASLGKLRRHFNDQLLERQGLRYVLTPLALTLRSQVEVAVRAVQHTFDNQPEFEAAQSDREFRLIASDYAQVILGSRLLNLAEKYAPNVRLRFENVGVHTVDDLETRMRGVDIALLPTGFVDGYPHAELFRDVWALAAWAGNDQIGTDVSLEAVRGCPRISTFDSERTFTYADRQLAILGFDRSATVVDGFVATPFLLTGTRRVALLPRRLAERFQDAASLRILSIPLDTPPLIESMWWHPVNNADPGHRWLRRLLHDAATEPRRSSTDSESVPNAAVMTGVSEGLGLTCV